MITAALILRDIERIIRTNPAVRNWVKGQAEATWKIVGRRFFRHRPTIKEGMEQLRILIADLNQDEFPDLFPDRIGYLGFLLAQIGAAIQLKGRGCVISRFYVDDYAFYFPPTRKGLLSLQRTATEAYTYCALSYPKTKRSSEPEKYTFHGIILSGTTDVKGLGQALEEIVMNHRDKTEEELFMKLLKDRDLKTRSYELIASYPDNRFAFVDKDGIYNASAAWISWKNPQESRCAIAEDLNALLTSRAGQP